MLETRDLSVISTAGVAVLTTSQVQSLSTSQIISLTTSQITGFTTSQVAALTTYQVEAMVAQSPELITAMTTTQSNHLALGTPLVLDLNGDGVSTLSIQAGVQFDLFATGQKISTGWVSSSDGLLALDRNQDGVINDGSELFGEATQLSNGQIANDGFQALADLDSNADGVINLNDTDFSALRVWVDGNSDGVSQSDELLRLDELGITSLNVTAEETFGVNNGNIVGLTSSFTTTDGASHELADVWFVADKASAMASAMSGFMTSNAVAGDASLASLTATQAATSNPVIAAQVDVMRQYSSNGQLLANAVDPLTSVTTLTVPATSAAQDILVLPNKG